MTQQRNTGEHHPLLVLYKGIQGSTFPYWYCIKEYRGAPSPTGTVQRNTGEHPPPPVLYCTFYSALNSLTRDALRYCTVNSLTRDPSGTVQSTLSQGMPSGTVQSTPSHRGMPWGTVHIIIYSQLPHKECPEVLYTHPTLSQGMPSGTVHISNSPTRDALIRWSLY